MNHANQTAAAQTALDELGRENRNLAPSPPRMLPSVIT
jgi:hypothetical protein